MYFFISVQDGVMGEKTNRRFASTGKERRWGEELSSLPWIDTPTQITEWMGHYLIKARLRCLFGYPVILYNSRIEASRPTGLVFT